MCMYIGKNMGKMEGTNLLSYYYEERRWERIIKEARDKSRDRVRSSGSLRLGYSRQNDGRFFCHQINLSLSRGYTYMQVVCTSSIILTCTYIPYRILLSPTPKEDLLPPFFMVCMQSDLVVLASQVQGPGGWVVQAYIYIYTTIRMLSPGVPASQRASHNCLEIFVVVLDFMIVPRISERST